MSADQDGCNFNTYTAPSDLNLESTQYGDEYRRICKIVASNPDGLTQEEIATKLHGLDDDDLPIDGSDSRYQRIRRFVSNHPDLFDIEPNNGITIVRATLDLLSLIISGTIQTDQDGSYESGKYFCEKMLKTARPQQVDGGINWDISDKQQWHMTQCFADYIGRIDDLRIILEALDPDTSPQYLSLPYRTRFNDSGRVSKQFSIFNKTLEKAGQIYDTASYGTLTTDPAHFDSLWDSIVDINKNWNRFMSWISADSRLGYRPEYVKILEFQDSGNPHLHFVIFLNQENDGSMPWLVSKSDLDDYWSKWQGGYINDLQPLVYQSDLGSDYGSDAGWVRWRKNGNHGGLMDRSRNDGSSGNQTVEQYLGKYLSKTFGMVEEIASDGSEAVREAYTGDGEAWKLALYWATGRKIKTVSRDLRQLVEDDHDDDPDGELGDILRSEYRVVGSFTVGNIPHRIRSQMTHIENLTKDDSEEFGEFEVFESADRDSGNTVEIGGYKV